MHNQSRASLPSCDAGREVKRRYLTISVDDGYPSDSRTAELLLGAGLSATFYVPARNPEHALLAAPDLRTIAASFEIGAHTFNHCVLNTLPDDQAFREISDGKAWLEDRISAPVVSFCYPRGKFGRRTPHLVREAGLLGARTCMLNLNEFPRDRYLAGVSTQAYAHAPHIQIRHAIHEGNLRGLRDYFRISRMASDWATHFTAALKWVDRHGGVAHLYLHSWEIDAQDGWEKLRELLEHAASYERLTRVTNGELFQLCAAREVEHASLVS
ncbi:MAG: polysaccharide deacetylase family protein [Gemmatimonadaceae bacterium]